MPEYIDGHVNLAALTPLGLVITDPSAAFRDGLQRAPIKNDRTGPGWLGLVQAQPLTQVVGQGFEYPGVPPTGLLLVTSRLGQQIVGRIPPCAAYAHYITQRVKL